MKFRIPMIFISTLVLFVVGVGLLDSMTSPNQEDPKPVTTPVSSKVGTTTKDYTSETFLMPVSKEIPLVRYFYEANSSTNQEALDYFEGVYRQSEGIDYGQEESFEVLASLSGTVSSVEKDSILGACVTIDCENNLQLIYQSLRNISVREGESVAQGSLIGESGHNIYEAELGNHIHFTVLKDGNPINPLSVMNKQVKDIN